MWHTTCIKRPVSCIEETERWQRLPLICTELENLVAHVEWFSLNHETISNYKGVIVKRKQCKSLIVCTSLLTIHMLMKITLIRQPIHSAYRTKLLQCCATTCKKCFLYYFVFMILTIHVKSNSHVFLFVKKRKHRLTLILFSHFFVAGRMWWTDRSTQFVMLSKGSVWTEGVNTRSSLPVSQTNTVALYHSPTSFNSSNSSNNSSQNHSWKPQGCKAQSSCSSSVLRPFNLADTTVTSHMGVLLWSGFQLSTVKRKRKLSLWPITTDANNAMN